RHRLAALRHGAQLDVAELALLQLHLAAEAAVADVLAREGAARPFEGVQIEVEVELADRLPAAVAPDQPFLALDGVLVGIEDRLEVVVGDALGTLAAADAAPRLLAGRRAHRA